jgi:hypothetical protein
VSSVVRHGRLHVACCLTVRHRKDAKYSEQAA